MAKTKNRVSSDKVYSGSKTKPKPKNPFEVHVYNEKLAVLGRRNKHKSSAPGVSRAKAIDKRKKTLLQEYKLKDKSNTFRDRRIGEGKDLPMEEKQMARYAAVKIKAHKRKSLFNLGEDEILTHKGQTLSELEKFDDPRSDPEDFDEDDETGKLDRQFVGEAHFGGGMLKKIGTAKSHRELIDELILESKKRKAEKKKIKEATMELTEKLDTEWKDLLPLVNRDKKETENNVEKPRIDDYDRVMRELRFEARGTVSDRLKSDDEIAKEEKEKLEQLEKERQVRMKGIEGNSTKIVHRSADDLDDNFVYEDENEVVVSYNQDGSSNFEIEDENRRNHDENEQSEESDESVSDRETSDDDLSDLKDEESESEDDESDEIVKQELKTKETREELPFTFALPENYEKLQETLSQYNFQKQGIVIERMIKCNHSSLAKGNKDNLGLLFVYILQYINDVASEAINEESIENCFRIFDVLMPHLFDLGQINQQACHNAILEVIKEKFSEFSKHPKRYPGIENLLFLKMVDVLFTTSDFRHQIVTPCLIFMETMLINCHLKTKRDISYGLFLSTLVLEYTFLSKRFMPGCAGFLAMILNKFISMEISINKQETSETRMNIKDLINGEISDSFKVRAIFACLKQINEYFENLNILDSCIEIFAQIYDNAKCIDLDNYPEFVEKERSKFVKQYETVKTERLLEYIVLESKKPKALRLYEPKIVEIFDGKRHKSQSKDKAERNKLMHKVKRERKGALREIRRDNAFLGRVKINQQIQSDKERREKVKRIFTEASIQQSELNQIDRKKKKK